MKEQEIFRRPFFFFGDQTFLFIEREKELRIVEFEVFELNKFSEETVRS